MYSGKIAVPPGGGGIVDNNNNNNNREFRSLGNRKNYLKFTKATLQGNDVRVYLCLHCTIIFAIIDFFVRTFFSIFFSCTFKHPRSGSK
jgi:hypothetical protein